MTVRTVMLLNDRKLFVDTLGASVNYRLDGPFAALVPAFNSAERLQVEAVAGDLVNLGCVEFCCMGPQAERLHDSLDSIIEARGLLQVVTTWHTDLNDACEYFLFAAGGKPRELVALIASHPEVVALLEAEP